MFSNIFTFFYIKRATQAALPRHLHHPKKMIVRLRFGSSRWTFAASTSPKKWSLDCDLAAVDSPRDDAASFNQSGTRCRVPVT
jgi:hypothetical protein